MATTIELNTNEGNTLTVSFQDFEQRNIFVERYLYAVEKTGRVTFKEDDGTFTIVVEDFNTERFYNWYDFLKQQTSELDFGCVARYVPYVDAINLAVLYHINNGSLREKFKLHF